MVVLHYTAMHSAGDAIARLCDPEHQVSAHYVVAEDGTVSRLVREEDRAWHAGAGAWGDVTDVNSHSIGIELANAATDTDCPPFAAPQMHALEELLDGILARWAIPKARVIGHSDCAVGRKFDPGAKFDWRRLALSGLAVWPMASAAVGVDWPLFLRAAHQVGYRAPRDDAPANRAVLDAVRLRFASSATGDLSVHDMGLITALAAEHPCACVDLGEPIA